MRSEIGGRDHRNGRADGLVGVRVVKEKGGIILVQDPAEAVVLSMPRKAIAAGADLVLRVRDIAAKGKGAVSSALLAGCLRSEKPFSKIKSFLERIAARTADARDAALGEAFRAFTPKQCMNEFATSGNDAV